MMGMGIGVVLLIFILNTTLLRYVYYHEKEEAMKKTFSELSAASEKTGTDTQEFATEFEAASVKRNVSMLIIRSDGDVLLSTRGENENPYMVSQLLFLILGNGPDNEEGLLETGSNYTLRKYHDDRLNSDFLVLWGVLKDGNFIMIRTGIESITESIGIFNKFLLFGAIFGLVVSFIVAMMLSKRISSPIIKLTEISNKMSNLDFDEKYATREKGNEVDILGFHMNRMSETLEKTINELTEANKKLQEDLDLKEQNEKMRREFISNVSHELKTPISLIRGYAEGLSEGVCENPEDAKYYTDVIMDEADRMNRIVSELSSLNKLEYGENVLAPEKFDLTEMIKGLIDSVKVMSEKYGTEISFDESNPVYVFEDEFLTEQAVSNYLTNAIRYSKGEKKIRVSIFEDEEDENLIRVSVFNTGDGIPEESLERVWDKFYKIDPARTREVGGTGIGLSVVKAVTEAFKTECGVRNTDCGVEFFLTLHKN